MQYGCRPMSQHRQDRLKRCRCCWPENVGQSHPTEHAEDRPMNLIDWFANRAKVVDRALVLAPLALPDTCREFPTVFHCFEQLGQIDLICRTLEFVAALHAAVANQEALMAKFFEDIGQERLAQTETFGDLAGAAAPRPLAEVREDQECIVRFLAE